MEAILVIIYFLSFILLMCFIPSNDFLVTPFIKKIIPSKQYQKLFINYNITIGLNREINEENYRELFIKTSNIPQEYFNDFFLTGKLLKLNDTVLNIFPSEYYINRILLIRSYNTFIKYIKQNRGIIKFLSKVIFVPKNSISNYNNIVKYCFEDLSILVIELEENIFKTLEEFGEYNNIIILSKQLDLLPYKFLINILNIIIILILLFLLLYRALARRFLNDISRNGIHTKIINQLLFKLIILSLLRFELNSLYNEENIYIKHTNFWNVLAKCLMIINRLIIIFFEKIYLGFGIQFKYQQTYCYCIVYTVFYILFNPLRIPEILFMRIMFLIPLFSRMTYYSIKNIVYLIGINSKLYLNKIKYIIYSPVIKLKLFIVFIQLIILLVVAYFYLCINKYFLLKKENFFIIEKDIFLQSLESCFLILISIIYIPRKMPKYYNLYILLITGYKSNFKIKIKIKDNYSSSINKINFDNERIIQKYIDDNSDKKYIIINPSSFFPKNKNKEIVDEGENDQLILGKNIKLGKLMKF